MANDGELSDGFGGGDRRGYERGGYDEREMDESRREEKTDKRTSKTGVARILERRTDTL